jgi:hypothetical protein
MPAITTQTLHYKRAAHVVITAMAVEIKMQTILMTLLLGIVTIVRKQLQVALHVHTQRDAWTALLVTSWIMQLKIVQLGQPTASHAILILAKMILGLSI